MNERRPLRGIGSMATRQVLAALCESYARQAGQPVETIGAGGVDVPRRVREGETFDFVVLASDVIDRLAAEGHVDRSTCTNLVRSSIAVAVPAGAPHPDLSDEAAVRAAVLDARAIGYSTGPSGTHLSNLFARWGIADTVAGRLVQAPPGVPVASLIASGQVSIGFQQLGELAGANGIDVVGMLPAPIQSVTTFTGAVCATSADPQATRRLLAWLADDATAETKRRFALDPA